MGGVVLGEGTAALKRLLVRAHRGETLWSSRPGSLLHPQLKRKSVEVGQ